MGERTRQKYYHFGKSSYMYLTVRKSRKCSNRANFEKFAICGVYVSLSMSVWGVWFLKTISIFGYVICGIFHWLNPNSFTATKNFIISICHRWFFIFLLKGGSACPQPIPLWVVIASIIGGVLAVGLGILLVLKIIIMVMERLEYHRFLKDARHVQWANVRNFLTKNSRTLTI